MLCISMKPSEYFTVGKETVVQFDRLSGDRVHLIIATECSRLALMSKVRAILT